MVQKEVADRMQAGPGSKDYGALSLAVQYYAEPLYRGKCSAQLFYAQTEGGVSGDPADQAMTIPPVEVEDEKLMFRIIRASFNQRRKTLANGLKNAADLDIPKELITECMSHWDTDHQYEVRRLRWKNLRH